MAQIRRPLSQELSFRAIILGIILSIVMGAANVYLGLKVGMTVSASIPAAVFAMLILRGIFRTGTIWEANQVQNAASAGESLAAGVIYTMPAMLIIGAWTKFDMWTTTVVAFSGGLLGVLFMIPMRKVFITNEQKGDLKFPEAVACAAVLKSGSAENGKTSEAMGVVYGALFGGVIKLVTQFAGLVKETFQGAFFAGKSPVYFGGDVSAALIAVGYIVGFNISLLVFIGGAVAWLVAIPLIGMQDPDFTGTALEAARMLHKSHARFMGVGAMAIGGMVSIYKVRHGLVEAIKELSKNFKKKSTNEHDSDISTAWIIALMLVCVAMIAGVYFVFTQNTTVTALTTVLMLIMGFFFTAVASYIVGLVGNSNSPVSGMTISAVLVTAGLLYILGYAGMEGMVATIGVAAVVCCVACTSGDMANELKIGHLVGSSPVRQQVMQIIGVVVASLVLGPVMQLLSDTTPGGLGGPQLPAPQAGMFASLAQGIFGDGQIPWNMVVIGVCIAIVVLIIDGVLSLKKAKFRAYLMPFAVGLYLPFGVSAPMLIGGLLAAYFTRKAKTEEESEKLLGRGILFASGAIAGESLMGVGLAGLASAGIVSAGLVLSDSTVSALTWVGVGAMLVIFYFAVKPKKAS